VTATKRTKKIRARRAKKVRSKIVGTVERPRLSVFRSIRFIYVQAIDDTSGTTIAEASSMSKDLKGTLEGLKKVDAAKEVGKLLAKRLSEKKINAAVFDRGRFLYHGRVKSLAEAIRESGIKL
jgi:large subunit ribosomal protein L18